MIQVSYGIEQGNTTPWLVSNFWRFRWKHKVLRWLSLHQLWLLWLELFVMNLLCIFRLRSLWTIVIVRSWSQGVRLLSQLSCLNYFSCFKPFITWIHFNWGKHYSTIFLVRMNKTRRLGIKEYHITLCIVSCWHQKVLIFFSYTRVHLATTLRLTWASLVMSLIADRFLSRKRTKLIWGIVEECCLIGFFCNLAGGSCRIHPSILFHNFLKIGNRTSSTTTTVVRIILCLIWNWFCTLEWRRILRQFRRRRIN